VYLLGILPISSVRMRPRPGFRAFSYNACSTVTTSAPMQRPQASLLSERRNAGLGSAYARRRSTHDRTSSKDPTRYHHGR